MHMNVSRLHWGGGGCQITETGCCDGDNGEARLSQCGPGTPHSTAPREGQDWKQPQEPHAAGPGPGLESFDIQGLHWAPGTAQALSHFVGVQVSLRWGPSGHVLGLRGLPFLCGLDLSKLWARCAQIVESFIHRPPRSSGSLQAALRESRDQIDPE